MKLNSKFFALLSIVITIISLVYFIFFTKIDNQDTKANLDTEIQRQNKISENYPTNKSENPTQTYSKEINSSAKNYKDIFKEELPHKDLIRNMEEEKNIKAIELKAQQLIKETQEFLIKNSLSIPPNKMTPEQHKQFEIKTQELEKKLEKLQNNIQEI